MKPAVSYLRVSTDRQGKSGLGLEAQRQAIARFVEAEGFEVVNEFVEVETGKGSDALDRRPKLKAALAAAKKAKAPVIVAKLDRLSRNTHFVTGLMEKRVPFIVAALGPKIDPFMLSIYAAVAQQERDLISQRTREALAAAKARGVKLGGPNPAEAAKRSREVRGARADAFAANVLPIIDQIRASGVSSLRGIARALNARGVSTPQGGPWGPVQVSDVIKRTTAPEPVPERGEVQKRGGDRKLINIPNGNNDLPTIADIPGLTHKGTNEAAPERGGGKPSGPQDLSTIANMGLTPKADDAEPAKDEPLSLFTINWPDILKRSEPEPVSPPEPEPEVRPEPEPQAEPAKDEPLSLWDIVQRGMRTEEP